ncbi:MAG: hypothetical protein KAG53_11990 [Endozoicomonadaceae bacterium]|nr:hypothetical protein [Endozoicomonadaceae bacterium]
MATPDSECWLLWNRNHEASQAIVSHAQWEGGRVFWILSNRSEVRLFAYGKVNL